MKIQEFMNKSHLMALYKDYQSFFSPLSKEVKKLGTNLNDSLILLALFFEPNKDSSPSQLEETFSIPKDQVSQSLNRLESKGFIKRNINPIDKRKRSLEITSQGKKQASQLVKCFDQKEAVYETRLKNNEVPSVL